MYKEQRYPFTCICCLNDYRSEETFYMPEGAPGGTSGAQAEQTSFPDSTMSKTVAPDLDLAHCPLSC